MRGGKNELCPPPPPVMYVYSYFYLSAIKKIVCTMINIFNM
jgi:hypothetical protein